MQRSSERNADKTVFLRDCVGPYIRRAESMKTRRRNAEYRVVEAEAEIESLRWELADTRDEVTALRDAATQASRIAARLREVEDELTRALEVWDLAVNRQDQLRRDCEAEVGHQLVAMKEKEDTVARAVEAEGSIASVRKERDLACQEVINLHSSLGRADNQLRRLREEQDRNTSTMTCHRDERAAAHGERDQARGQVTELREELEQTQAELTA
jgi:chromosome segregation ATPase